MPKNIARITTCVVVAFTLVLTQGFLGGTPLFSSDGVAVALTPAEKAAKKAARKAAKKAKKAGQAGSRSADKAARNADKVGRKVDKAARNADKVGRKVDKAARSADRAARNTAKAAISADKAARNIDAAGKNIFRAGGGTDGLGVLTTPRTEAPADHTGMFGGKRDKAVTDSDGISDGRGLELYGDSSDRAPDAISITKKPMAPDVTQEDSEYNSSVNFKDHTTGSPIDESSGLNHRPRIMIEDTDLRTLDGVTSQNGLLLQQHTGTSNSALDAPSTNLESKEIPMIKRKFSKKSSPN